MSWRQLAGAGLFMARAAIAPHLPAWAAKYVTPVNKVRNASNEDSSGSDGRKGKRVVFKPDFAEIADHFAIHAGGFAVLKGVQLGMDLPPSTMLPSFASLRDYGNTSGSTTWVRFELPSAGFQREEERGGV